MSSRLLTLAGDPSEKATKELEEFFTDDRTKSSCDPNTEFTQGGWAPIHLVCSVGNARSLQILIDNGAKNDLPRKSDGMLPVFVALNYGHESCLEVLIKSGVDIHQSKNDEGDAPLAVAAKSNQPNACKILLKAGASILIVNALDGSTAITKAEHQGHRELAAMLRSQVEWPGDNKAKWQPDTAVKSCNICQKDFWLFRRRSHCRQCCKVFCRECAGKFIEISGVKRRVCEWCAKKL